MDNKASNATLALSLYDDEYYYEEDGCDESRCVSIGRSNLHNRSFTCYGDDGTHFPRMCADGFLPVVVEDEPPRMSARFRHTLKWTEKWELLEDVPVQYFTCCPPQHAAVVAGDPVVARQCDDPVGGSDAGTDAVCGGLRSGDAAAAARMHPRWMKPNPRTTLSTQDSSSFAEVSIPDNSFMCCSEPLETDKDNYDDGNESNRTTYIEDTQCVPYRDDYYHASRLDPNRLGDSRFMSCDFSGGDFPVVSSPSLSSQEGDGGHVPAAGLYRCCRDGPAIQSIVVRDSAFWIYIGLTLFFFIIAVVVSVVVFVSLLIPLINRTHRTPLSQTGNRTQTRPQNNNTPTREEKPYSAYNLYLVHLSFWDLVIHTTWCVSLGMVLTGKHRYSSMFIPILTAYFTANFWINAFIAHQVLVLLQSSWEARRIVPVSLTRANLEFAAASAIAVAASCSEYFFGTYFSGNTNLAIMLVQALLWVLPIVYVLYAFVLILKRGYLSSAIRPAGPGNRSSGPELRELAIYFFRIVAIFSLLWIPGHVLSLVWVETDSAWGLMVWSWVPAIQTILTFVAILTKSDARGYIRDLVTLSCCVFGRSTTEPQQQQRRGRDHR